jgi:hypothetical protein
MIVSRLDMCSKIKPVALLAKNLELARRFHDDCRAVDVFRPGAAQAAGHRGGPDAEPGAIRHAHPSCYNAG